MLIKEYVAKIEKQDDETIAIISTSAVDRDGDIIDPLGVDTTHFENNPVILWAHDHKQPAIGRATWIKSTKDDIRAKIRWAKTAAAQEIKGLYDDGILSAFSIGFIPQEWEDREESEHGKRFTRSEMLEFSGCNVPSNPEALMARAVSKDFSAEARDMLGIIVKRPIPYKKYPLASEGTAWDAGREVRNADVNDLKIMGAWFDAENAENKLAYKLPHHKANGYTTIWRGVAAAMGALLGARGGVRIPTSDRQSVYNHLKKHYADFDKDAPEFKDYNFGELMELHFDKRIILDYKWLEMLGPRGPEVSGRDVSPGYDEELAADFVSRRLTPDDVKGAFTGAIEKG